MRRKNGRTTTTEWIINELARATATRYHPGDQFGRFCRRMQLADHWTIDLEDRILASVASKIVWSVLQPSVQYRLAAIMIVAATKYEALFDPYQAVPIGKPAILKTLDEVLQEGTRNCSIDDRSRECILP